MQLSLTQGCEKLGQLTQGDQEALNQKGFSSQPATLPFQKVVRCYRLMRDHVRPGSSSFSADKFRAVLHHCRRTEQVSTLEKPLWVIFRADPEVPSLFRSAQQAVRNSCSEGFRKAGKAGVLAG